MTQHKITREVPWTRPSISLTSFTGGAGGAPSGQVPTSIGSNGQVSWSSNVGLITVNDVLVSGPFVNFANGSNTTVSVSSNTIRVHVSATSVSPLTTKGDLFTRSASADARLAVGSNGTGVIADSGETVGIRWTTAALHGELLMQDGVTGPPVPLETDPAQNDWLYGDL